MMGFVILILNIYKVGSMNFIEILVLIFNQYK